MSSNAQWQSDATLFLGLIEEIMLLQFIFSGIEALYLQLNQKLATDCHQTCKCNDNQMSQFGLIEEITLRSYQK